MSSFLVMYNAPNKYEVLDTWGRRIFFAAETSSFWDRNGCCNCAPFTMSILNFGGQEVLYAKGSQGCCCDAVSSRSHYCLTFLVIELYNFTSSLNCKYRMSLLGKVKNFMVLLGFILYDIKYRQTYI